MLSGHMQLVVAIEDGANREHFCHHREFYWTVLVWEQRGRREEKAGPARRQSMEHHRRGLLLSSESTPGCPASRILLPIIINRRGSAGESAHWVFSSLEAMWECHLCSRRQILFIRRCLLFPDASPLNSWALRSFLLHPQTFYLGSQSCLHMSYGPF